MEITIKINGQAVSVEVSIEVYAYLDQADHKTENLAHEPLISKEMWDIVCGMDEKQVIKRQPKEGKSSIFSGIVHCGDCGFKMVSQVERMAKKDGSVSHFSCLRPPVCSNRLQ